MKRIMVDMSAVLLHHGHVRLLAEASKYGDVIVALTSDEEIFNKKGVMPELYFEERKEILNSIRYVSEVVESPWLIDESFLDMHNIDILVHGNDNANSIPAKRLKIFPRTEGVSTTEIRRRAAQNVKRLQTP